MENLEPVEILKNYILLDNIRLEEKKVMRYDILEEINSFEKIIKKNDSKENLNSDTQKDRISTCMTTSPR